MEDRCKLTVYPQMDSGILIDLDTDPHEQHNVWDDPACAQTKARLTLALLDELARSDRADIARISGA